jgi:hypothetical protein
MMLKMLQETHWLGAMLMNEPFPFINAHAPALGGRKLPSPRQHRAIPSLDPGMYKKRAGVFCGNQLHLAPDGRPFMGNAMPYFSKNNVALGFISDEYFATTSNASISEGAAGLQDLYAHCFSNVTLREYISAETQALYRQIGLSEALRALPEFPSLFRDGNNMRDHVVFHPVYGDAAGMKLVNQQATRLMLDVAQSCA